MSPISEKKGKIALVTGATSGIGKSTAFLLLNEGFEVIFTGRDFKNIENEIYGRFSDKCRFHFFKADFLQEADVEKLVAEVKGITDRIDVLIHSAGIIEISTVEKSDIRDLDKMYQVNLRTPYLLTQKFLPMLKMAKGSVVFVNSTAGLHAWEEISQYAATKHGLTGFAKSLKSEVSKDSVNIISVFLRGTDTPMQQRIQKSKGEDYHPNHFIPVQDIGLVILNAIKTSEDYVPPARFG